MKEGLKRFDLVLFDNYDFENEGSVPSVTHSSFYSSTPRGAALKAATRDHERIVLIEDDHKKVHIFRGGVRTFAPESRNEFMTKNNIWKKATVQKVGLLTLDTRLNFQKIDDVYNLLQRIEQV